MGTSMPPRKLSYEITEKDAARVKQLVWHASSKEPLDRERRIDNWSDADKQLFVDVSDRACGYGKFVIDKVLGPLNMDEIHSLLRQFYHSYRESPTMFLKWFSAEKSFKAMSTCVSEGELMSYMNDVFGGRDKWLNKLLTSNKDTVREAFRSPDMFAVSFPEGVIPFKRMELSLVHIWSKVLNTDSDIVQNSKLFDLVVHSARHYLKMGGLTAQIVQDVVITCVSRRGDSDSSDTMLTSIYSEPALTPGSDSWTKLIFGRLDGSMCNTCFDEWRDADEDECDIYEISFCSECCDFYEASGTSCTCVNLLLPRVCKFLMKKGVQIPDEFWERCAYHNLWHFAHHLHTYRPESFRMNIPIGAFKKALRYDRIGFAKFLVQYKYFSLSDVPRNAQISTKMREMLGVGTKKQRRDEIMTAQSVLDEFKQEMPENTYIEMCKRYKDCFD